MEAEAIGWLERFLSPLLLSTTLEGKLPSFWEEEYGNILFLFDTLKLPSLSKRMHEIDTQILKKNKELHAALTNSSVTYHCLHGTLEMGKWKAGEYRFTSWPKAVNDLTLASLSGQDAIPDFWRLWEESAKKNVWTIDRVYFITHWIVLMERWRPNTSLSKAALHQLASWMDQATWKLEFAHNKRWQWLEPILEWLFCRRLLAHIVPLPATIVKRNQQLEEWLLAKDMTQEKGFEEVCLKIYQACHRRRNLLHIRYHLYFLRLQFLLPIRPIG